MDINPNTPLWQLTVGQFQAIFNASVVASVEEQAPPTPKNLVYGISGLANLLHCSKTWAQSLKNSGKLDAAIVQHGRKIIIDADLVIQLLKT